MDSLKGKLGQMAEHATKLIQPLNRATIEKLLGDPGSTTKPEIGGFTDCAKIIRGVRYEEFSRSLRDDRRVQFKTAEGYMAIGRTVQYFLDDGDCRVNNPYIIVCQQGSFEMCKWNPGLVTLVKDGVGEPSQAALALWQDLGGEFMENAIWSTPDEAIITHINAQWA